MHHPLPSQLNVPQQQAFLKVLQANPVAWDDDADTHHWMVFAGTLYAEQTELHAELKTELAFCLQEHFGDYFAGRLLDQLVLMLRVFAFCNPKSASHDTLQ